MMMICDGGNFAYIKQKNNNGGFRLDGQFIICLQTN